MYVKGVKDVKYYEQLIKGYMSKVSKETQNTYKHVFAHYFLNI